MWRFLNNEVRQRWFFANVTYLMVAGGIVARAALHLFRYRVDSYYDPGLFKGEFTNWFERADLIRNWGEISLYGLAAFTQFLATFGFFTGINLLVWQYVGYAYFLLQATVFGIRFWQYELARSRKTDSTYSNYYRKQYEILEPLLKEDMRTDFLFYAWWKAC